DKLGARLSAGGDIGEVSFMIEAKRDKLAEVVKFVTEMAREPIFPDEELDVLKREMRDTLEKALTEPMELASREFRRRLSPYPPEDVRYTPTLEESLARL